MIYHYDPQNNVYVSKNNSKKTLSRLKRACSCVAKN